MELADAFQQMWQKRRLLSLCISFYELHILGRKFIFTIFDFLDSFELCTIKPESHLQVFVLLFQLHNKK